MSVGKLEGVGGRVDQQLTVTVVRDELGYGMTVSGNDPVVVASVVVNGAAWRAGVRYGDRLIRVNGTHVEKSMHDEVVKMIKSSTNAELVLQRPVFTSKVTAPLPVDSEKQRQVENNKIQTLKMMLEDENRHKERLKSSLVHSPSERNRQELEAAEARISKLIQQIKNFSSPFIPKDPVELFKDEPPAMPPRQPQPISVNNVPRSLTALTNQSLRGSRNSMDSSPPVTCLDGTPPPLPPRTPNTLSPGAYPSSGGGVSPRTHTAVCFPTIPPPPPLSALRLTEPNSIGVQMNYPLAAMHPPVQTGAGHHAHHQRSRSSPEHLNQLNHSDSKEWEMVVTPPGTPPPPYLTQSVHQGPTEVDWGRIGYGGSQSASRERREKDRQIDPQKNIISMEEDDTPGTLMHSQYSSRGFINVSNLSPARRAVFLNWLAGEKRPPQAALFYFLSSAYSSGPANSLQRWAYELHSVFLVPGAPLVLNNIDENMAKEIDDILINDSDKEYILKNIFSKVRKKAEEELNQQLSDFHIKRQSGLGSFFGPADAELDACDNDSLQKTQVIKNWLMPKLCVWMQESQNDIWGVTHGSAQQAIFAAAVHPLLQYTFGCKSDVINYLLNTPTTASPPRPAFLQRDKSYKQRIKHLNKTTSHPLMIRGHHLSPITVTTICHCHHCHLLVWGVAPQAYNCSDCKLRVHRSCAKRIEEPCPGPPASATRMSRIIERLAPGPVLMPTGNSHQHIESNQHLHHHHHHDKKRKSLAASHFLNLERNSRKTEEENTMGDSNASFSDIELEINPPNDQPTNPTPEEEKSGQQYNELEEGEKMDELPRLEPTPPIVVHTDSECDDKANGKKSKTKPKHRKTMSMSNTIELVRSVGDEWLEAAKREIGEHSKKSQAAKNKKKESLCHEQSTEKNDVVLLLSDATVGETDEFDLPSSAKSSKKSSKSKEAPLKNGQVSVPHKMGVRMIARASTASALNFIRKKRSHNAPVIDADGSAADHIMLMTELFLDSERVHSDMVRPAGDFKVKPKATSDEVDHNNKATASEEDEQEIFFDAKEDVAGSDNEDRDATSQGESKQQPSKASSSSGKDPKVIGSRTRKSFGGSLKRTGGGRRKARRKSSVDEAPPLPPKMPPPPKEAAIKQQSSHWLFGSSFRGDGKTIADEAGDAHHPLSEPWDKGIDHHSTDRAENSHSSARQRPVTRAESYRDKAAKVHRTKRKTSDPNQLTSGNAYNDADASGTAGAPSGASSSSSLSSRSNESAGHLERHDSDSDWSDEEESSEPWSTQAPAELVATLSVQARKRQDLIHELITTEMSHVRWLKTLKKVFFRPLQHSKLLTGSELRALFPNLPDVYQRHRRLRTDLKTLAESGGVVKTKPLAEVLINTLGEPKFRVELAKFCVGQGLALDALREKQKRNKELNSLIAKSEQHERCWRRRLPDLLACVWQRLTKYPLLLEGIYKTGKDDDVESETSEESGHKKIHHALELAKEILHSVNTAMKTAENEHKLKSIQSKLEVRGVGGIGGSESDPGELRRLDLTRHSLVMDGNLIIWQDSTKRLTVYALMLNECLVLLQKESSDRYILRPIPQEGRQPLSPVIQWNTVLFRTNAAVKNGFFLVNINGHHMYSISATSSTEYNTWTRFVSEAAKGFGSRSGPVEEGPPPPLPPNPPPVQATRQEEAPHDTSEPNTSVEEDKDDTGPTSNPDESNETSGTSSALERDSPPKINNVKLPSDEFMIPPSSVDTTDPPSAQTAYRQLTPEERLRQAEQKVILALKEAAEAAKEVVNTPATIYSAMDSLLGKTALGNGLHESSNNAVAEETSTKNLLMAAQMHVDNLTEILFKALRVTSTNCPMTQCSVHVDHGLCDTCFTKHSKFLPSSSSKRSSKINVDPEIQQKDAESTTNTENDQNSKETNDPGKVLDHSQSVDTGENKLDSFVMLEAVGESSTDPSEEADPEVLAAASVGLREILSTLVKRLPSEEQEKEVLRARLQQADQRLHRLHHLHRDCAHSDDTSAGNNGDAAHSNSNDQNNGG